MSNKKRLIVAISGADGIQLAFCLLRLLKDNDEIESHLVISKGAEKALGTLNNIDALKAMADVVYDNEDNRADIASGSYETIGMIVIPCSMKTLSSIRNSYADGLIARAADVCIKEHRCLVLVTRESPLSAIHLDNMAYLARLQNVFIMPPVLTYYTGVNSLKDMEIQIVGRILNKFKIVVTGYQTWNSKNKNLSI
ncbi:UbiX family flavin prenyltransferase [Dielma fastidiosa]|uniref:4-hydroxy-3-polyprenylbenzoate decarboxylase n=1 Tax=Dielma fastidiosa TaxID=1034346 RepID=A0A318LEQ7_9FIRM|nr:UbiX family flavin prenyltransferase [Dielma fastidiosa]PXX80127.1 4-hydroxy-3-polyprenylbenzoate decarboxylase [Dielma fastidiosa]